MKTAIAKEWAHPATEGAAPHFTGEDSNAFHRGLQTWRGRIFP